MAPTTESCLGLGEKWLQRLRVVWVWVRGAPPPPRARGPWPPGRLPCTAKKCFLTGRPGVPREPAPPPTAPSAGARAIRKPRGGSRAHARWPGRRWSGHRGRPRLQRARSARRVERTECASMPRAAPRDVSNVPTVAGRPPGCGSAAGRPPPRALSSQRTSVRNVPSPLPLCSSSPSESPSPCESHSAACCAPSPDSPENHASQPSRPTPRGTGAAAAAVRTGGMGARVRPGAELGGRVAGSQRHAEAGRAESGVSPRRAARRAADALSEGIRCSS
jgi:hypothetical protein